MSQTVPPFHSIPLHLSLSLKHTLYFSLYAALKALNQSSSPHHHHLSTLLKHSTNRFQRLFERSNARFPLLAVVEWSFLTNS
ncbi:hypothetical protein ACSBR2_010285 [Camellia fascicularis]